MRVLGGVGEETPRPDDDMSKKRRPMFNVPAYIAQRLVDSPPDGCCVVPCTIPQIGEGPVEFARIVTVGINPHGPRSCKDYSPRGDCELDMRGVQRAYDDKRLYFVRRKYGYFTHLEHILNACNATYGGRYAGDREYERILEMHLAASLDLVQWCTDPLWSKLPRDVRERLLGDGKSFFKNTLRHNPNIELLLGNGRSVVEQVERSFGTRFRRWTEEGLGTDLYCGEVLGRQFIGWSAFLSNSPMNKAQRAQLAKRVRELYRSGCN